MRQGFTLVELAIVLVVIGLVAGGAVIGFDMVRASELRAVSNEFSQYVTAVQNFRTRYSAIPGDMKTATSIWGDNATACADATITDGSPGTCNGDGDGVFDDASAANTTGERFQFWNQLSYSGFIGGYFSGVAGSGGVAHHVINSNHPASKFEGAGWSVGYLNNYAGDSVTPAHDYQRYFMVGAQRSSTTPAGAIFRPADALSIDQKLDDGRPATGGVIALYWNNACSNGSSNTDTASTYRASDASAQCALVFPRAF